MPGRRRQQPVFEPDEGAITSAVITHWRCFGVRGSLVASIPNLRAFGQYGLTRGLPDLLVLTPQLGERSGFIELKTERGRLSVEQKVMRDFLVGRGVPYAICRGRDEPIAQLEEWGAVRRQRAAA
jgi:hypothetical protein